MVGILGRRGAAGGVVVVLAVAAYAWWVAGLAPFSGRMLVAVLAAGVVAVAVGWWQRRARPAPGGADEPVSPGQPGAPAGLVVWGVLLAALAGWELASYVQHPRDEHPTISHLLNVALEPRPVRALAFAGWLVAAYVMGRR